MSGLRTILVLREDCEFSRELRGRGYEVYNLPLIATRTLSDLSTFRELLADVRRFDHIFLTSRASAAVLADELTPEVRNALPAVHVLGARSKTILENAGVEVDYNDAANTADELLKGIDTAAVAGTRVLFIRGDKSLRTIPERIGPIAEVEEAIVYETVDVPLANEAAVERLNAGEIDWLCFFSPSAVDSFADRQILRRTVRPKVAVIGETTARAARSRGFAVDFISERAEAGDFARGLAGYIESFD